MKRNQACMDTIVTAKERQAAEANKNASILLEEIDEERRTEETKKVIIYIRYPLIIILIVIISKRLLLLENVKNVGKRRKRKFRRWKTLIIECLYTVLIIMSLIIKLSNFISVRRKKRRN